MTSGPVTAAALVGCALSGVMGLAACGAHGPDNTSADSLETPATVERLSDLRPPTITLTQSAGEKLGVETQPVRTITVTIQVQGKGGQVRTKTVRRKRIPYSAVVYDRDGSEWTFVQTAPLRFMRKPIQILDIDTVDATLNRGPKVDAEVVIHGAPELLGIEYDISGEE